MANTIVQAEREVWDILEAGPLQRFTANGRLVHNCLILDHSNTSLNLGLVTDIRRDQLLGGKSDAVQGIERPTPKPHECPKCAFLIPPMVPECPSCGYVRPRMPSVTTVRGELIEFEKAKELKIKKKDNRDWNYEDKAQFYGQLLGYADEKGYKRGWAARKYREKFDVWPDDPRVKYARPMLCGNTVRAWIKAQMIRWAKGKQRRYDEAQ